MTDHDPVTMMSDEEGWEMLQENEFGRLAFHLVDEVHIVPMNYAVDEHHRLIFRTAEGSKLLGLTINADVAFEIDEFGDEHARSVVVHGRARMLEGREAERHRRAAAAAVGRHREVQRRRGGARRGDRPAVRAEPALDPHDPPRGGVSRRRNPARPRRPQVSRRRSDSGAKRMTVPSGRHGHAGTRAVARRASIASTMARTPGSVSTMKGAFATRSFISERM